MLSSSPETSAELNSESHQNTVLQWEMLIALSSCHQGPPSSLNVPETQRTLGNHLLTLALQKPIAIYMKFRAVLVYSPGKGDFSGFISIQHKNERHGAHEGESSIFR